MIWILHDVLVKVDKFILLVDFIILDYEVDVDVPIILGRSFLTIGRALVDVERGGLRFRVNEEEEVFNIYKIMKHALKTPSGIGDRSIMGDMKIGRTTLRHDYSVAWEATQRCLVSFSFE